MKRCSMLLLLVGGCLTGCASPRSDAPTQRHAELARPFREAGLATFYVDGVLLAIKDPRVLDEFLAERRGVATYGIDYEWCCLSNGLCWNINCNDNQLPPNCIGCHYTAFGCHQGCTGTSE